MKWTPIVLLLLSQTSCKVIPFTLILVFNGFKVDACAGHDSQHDDLSQIPQSSQKIKSITSFDYVEIIDLQKHEGTFKRSPNITLSFKVCCY